MVIARPQSAITTLCLVLLWFSTASAFAARFAVSAPFPAPRPAGLASVRVRLATAFGKRKTHMPVCMGSHVDDAPDMEGQTICHWREESGSKCWALVEPNLAALKKEARDIKDACERLQRKITAVQSIETDASAQSTAGEAIISELETLRKTMKGTTLEEAFAWADLDASREISYDEWKEAFGLSESLFDWIDTNGDGLVSWQEFTEADSLRKQYAALHVKLEAVSLLIQLYIPEEHAPECIGEGGQGSILVGKDLSTGVRVAIKVERVQERAERELQKSALQREFNVLRALQDDVCFPNVLHYGRQMLNSRPSSTDCRVMVMQMLGASISDLWWETTLGARGFNTATALKMGVGMLELCQKLHNKGFIHRDIKPANFVMSGDSGRGHGHLCLIDFGLAVPFEEEALKLTEMQMSSGSSLTRPQFSGTRLYASHMAHSGHPQSYRDDLEALTYVLAHMLTGGLPWGDVTRDINKVGAMKVRALAAIVAGDCEIGGSIGGTDTDTDADTDTDTDSCAAPARELLSAHPQPVGDLLCLLFRHCGTLRFDEKPDYNYCKTAFMEAYSQVTGGKELENFKVEQYEWNMPKQPAKSKSLDWFDLM